jgi:hypothetical protein
MSRHRITAAEGRILSEGQPGKYLRNILRPAVNAIKASAIQLHKLQRNAADPEKARKRKGQWITCGVCHGCGTVACHAWPGSARCKACDGKGQVRAALTVADVTLERHVQPAIEDYLRAEGLVVIPINSGGATIIGGRACLKGVPDLLTWVPTGRRIRWESVARHWAVPCFIECKRPKGGRYSREQIAFRNRAQADGCLWIGCTGLEGVKAVIPPRGTK